MKKKKKSLLWQIQHPAKARPSFLFGTMHVRDDQAFRFLDIVFPYLQQCDALAAEYDLSVTADPRSAGAMLLPSGLSLPALLPPGHYQKLAGILRKAFQIDIRYYTRFTPLLLINVITEQLLRKDRPHALDQELWLQAGNFGIERLGIETLEEQMAVLRQIPLTQQLQLLRSLGRNVNRFRRSTLQSTDLYQSADPQRIYRMVRRSSQGLRSLLLFRRNHIMAERIDAIITGQPTFFAVGAGHLSGKEGLIRLLKNRGFILRAIPMGER